MVKKRKQPYNKRKIISANIGKMENVRIKRRKTFMLTEMIKISENKFCVQDQRELL